MESRNFSIPQKIVRIKKAAARFPPSGLHSRSFFHDFLGNGEDSSLHRQKNESATDGDPPSSLLFSLLGELAACNTFRSYVMDIGDQENNQKTEKRLPLPDFALV